MGERAKKLLNEALALPPSERADFAAELMASLDGEPDTDVDIAWATELEARAERAIAGQSQGSDWPTVRARIEERLSRK